jgi:hypothetical protein
LPGPEPLALGPGARTAWSVALVLIFGLQIGLGLRSRLHVDDRYGFAMFHEFTRYRIDYRWRLADGAVRAFTFPVPLPKRSSAVRGGRHHVEVFGAGTTRLQLRGALRYLWAAHRPDDAVAVEATYRWRRNDHPDETVEQLQWPPEAGP